MDVMNIICRCLIGLAICLPIAFACRAKGLPGWVPVLFAAGVMAILLWLI